jgi:excisionase family DNA binding protein
MSNDELMSVSAYALRIGVSEGTVRRYARLGFIPAYKVGPRLWRIDGDAALPDLPNRQRGPHPDARRIRNGN